MNRPATASQSLGNPERKNTPCISDLAGVKFLLKKERVFFFRGSALQVFGQCGGAKCGLGRAKQFVWGNGFALPRLISRPQEGSGEECGRVSDWGFSEIRRLMNFYNPSSSIRRPTLEIPVGVTESMVVTTSNVFELYT